MSGSALNGIAIVGTGCILPGAASPDALWGVALDARVVLDEAPAGRWRTGHDLRVGAGPDRARSARGGYVCTPLSACLGHAEVSDPLVRWPLHAATQALAGVSVPERAGLVLGNLSFPSPEMSAFAEACWAGQAAIPEAIAPPAVCPSRRFMSGRPAHQLRAALGWSGAAFALDAACASGLYALAFACDALLDRRVDLALAGAVNHADDLFLHVGFSSLGAISASGLSRPFHQEADGLLPAEGAAMVALKRLDDALRDGDPVLAIVRGVGLSNDGRGRSFLKPDERGQVRAMRRAWQQAGCAPESVGWVECHATGTPVGDATELRSLQEVVGRGGRIPIGSLKANLGHLITAAGSAALVKVVEALRRGVLPPQPAADAPLEAASGSDFTLLREPREWLGQRIAGVSAFGFGGNNAHVVLEQAPEAPTAFPPPRPVADDGATATVRAIGVRVGELRGAERFAAALESGQRIEGRASEILAPLGGAPPADLARTLAQQTLLLETLGDVRSALEGFDPERVGVYVGMGADAEVARFGLRWRLASCGADDLDGVTPALTPAGVVGTMPNMPANRLNRTLDAGALGVTISSEELSGVDALRLATRALASGEIDCALVGAVDLSCEAVHVAARRALGLQGAPLDASALLVLTRDGEGIGTIVESVQHEAEAEQRVARTLGVSHAAAGLLEIVGALTSPGDGERTLTLEAWTDERRSLRVTRTGGLPPAAASPTRTLALPAHAAPVVLPRVRATEPSPPAQFNDLPHAPQLPPTTLDAHHRGLAMRTLEGGTPLSAKPAPAPAPPASIQAHPTQPSPNGQTTLADHLVRVHVEHLQQRAAMQERFLHTMQGALSSYFSAMSASTLGPPAPVASHTPTTPAPTPFAPLTAAAPAAVAAPLTAPSPMPDAAWREAAIAPVVAATPVQRAAKADYPGPSFSREDLEVLASGEISSRFGPAFADQDAYALQTRMPEPPMLLCDRVLGIDAEPHSMGRGTIWTETDVTWDAWYLRDGVMPAGLMIESGQADLLLISWLGIDRHNRGERAYRLLGCELTYHGGLPKPGETLHYDIHVDGHARQGDVRMFFFHYDCRVGDTVRLSVRNGQAGFFSEAELEASMGILWSPTEGAPTETPRLDAGPATTDRRALSADQVELLRAGELSAALGDAFWQAQTHTRTPSIGRDHFAMFQRIDSFEPQGGPWGRGYLRATHEVRPDDWFFNGHFKNDPCMPGTLMLEGCLDTLAFVLTANGFTLDRDGWRFEPVADVTYHLRCRGQVIPTSKVLTYEVFVDEIVDGERPTIWADVLCTVDGLKAFHCSRLGLQLVPSWPTEGAPPRAVSSQAVAHIGALPIDERAMEATAVGRPSLAFGPHYADFDSGSGVPRLPGAPFLFVDRATQIAGEQDQRSAGTAVTTEFDVAPDAWFFNETPAGTMPWCVLLEAALQPCGWLASYTGGALGTDATLFFRNLDGNATIERQVTRESGRLVTTARCTRFARSGDTTIVAFDVTMHDAHGPILTLDTVFGFFTGAALARQVGLTPPESLTSGSPSPEPRALGVWPGDPAPAGERLRVLHEVTSVDLDAGAAGLGVARGVHHVRPADWFFQAHFYRDPVMPGSLGLEALRQLGEELVTERSGVRWVMDPIGVSERVTWTYRGQVIPSRERVDLRVELLEYAVEGDALRAVMRGALWCDGVPIYVLERFPLTGAKA